MPHVVCNSAGRTAAEINAYRDRHYVPKSMAISGAGVDHDVLVSLSEKYFGHLGPADESKSEVVLPPTPTDVAVYTGGVRFYPMDSSPSNNALGVELTQIGLGFKGLSWADEDLYTYAVLQLLLGGGLSFSVGGPGKGVFTRM
jgi:processing peptidase subunit alpha